MEEGASHSPGAPDAPSFLAAWSRGSAVSGYSGCEQPILATFHRKPDLRDRRGRKQPLPLMSVQNSGWPHQEDSPKPQDPGPPANSDSDSGHLPEEDPEDTSAQGPSVLSLGSLCLDTNQAPKWTGLRTLLQQLPPQDIDEHYCLALGEEERAELRLFCSRRKQEALGQGVARLVLPKLEGHTCEKCRELLKPGEYGVFAARAGEQRCWHQTCFACQACGQALINLIYFYHDGQLYCGRHHAELLRPRCPACDQLIFSQHCTEAEGQRWHENHFCCQDCAGPLGGGRYALPGGSPCCPSCFENRYSDAGSSWAGALEGQAFLGKGEDAEQSGRELGLGCGGSPGLGPSPRSHAVPSLQEHPHRTPPDPSLGARSSHRASLAGAFRRPPEPTPRRGRGCGAGLPPRRGTRPPSGGGGGPCEDSRRRRRSRPRGWAGRGERLGFTPASCGGGPAPHL
uniref:Prickle planar cell polarity protein 4 n=1 Tax=Papio anubis TaxID=9555 RepID=A0A2I3LJ97_PAPAN